jgi:hypothetical protein
MSYRPCRARLRLVRVALHASCDSCLGKSLLHSVVDIYKANEISNDISIQFLKDFICYLSAWHLGTL